MRIGGRAVFFRYPCADAGRGALARRPPGRVEAGVVPGLGAPGAPRRRGDVGPAAGVLVAGVVGVACWCGCYRRDRVVSMESASLTRRPRVRVTDVIGSEPIAWNSLSVKLPAGA